MGARLCERVDCGCQISDDEMTVESSKRQDVKGCDKNRTNMGGDTGAGADADANMNVKDIGDGDVNRC